MKNVHEGEKCFFQLMYNCKKAPHFYEYFAQQYLTQMGFSLSPWFNRNSDKKFRVLRVLIRLFKAHSFHGRIQTRTLCSKEPGLHVFNIKYSTLKVVLNSSLFENLLLYTCLRLRQLCHIIICDVAPL